MIYLEYTGVYYIYIQMVKYGISGVYWSILYLYLDGELWYIWSILEYIISISRQRTMTVYLEYTGVYYIYIQMENYDGVSGVYLGPSRTLDQYDLEYLNGDITENDDIQDSYRLLNIF